MKNISIALVLILLATSTAYGAGSPSMTPKKSKDIKYYNKVVQLIYQKKFTAAEKQFRRALNKRERFAEAHNNLAYVLRKQGPEHFEEALTHYNRAIALKPKLAQPYMYRGVLHVQMGSRDLAKEDYRRLEELDPNLAKELGYVIENGKEKEPEKFFGVSSRLG